ncbi:MAG TPA: TauD/TfdA family dioxygenase [Acidimicrobiia bacterium]|jgi:alpha-ketoglutarate-dependent taurine dioxygenase
MTTVNTKSLGDSVGVEVLDVDRERLLHDETLAEECLDLLDRHGVLVFRELHLDDETQVAFSRRLGPVERVGRRDDGAEIFRVTLDPAKNPAADYLKGTFDWHIDGMTDDIPIMATVLSAHAVAASGGDTEFASTYAAYEDLTPDEKERALETRVVHSFLAAQKLSHPNASDADIEMWSQRPPKTHPLVWNHGNGRKSLVLGATTDHVEGMGDAEGTAYLADLLGRSTVAERVYRHEWAVGDLVIWDNRGVLHRATRYDPSSARDMHRTTIAGNEAVQ